MEELMQKSWMMFDTLGIGTRGCSEELFVRTGNSLSSLFCSAAIEFDQYLQGKKIEGYYIDKFKELIGKNTISCVDLENRVPDAPRPLIKTFNKFSENELRDYSDYMLMMNGLYCDLSRFKSLNRKKLEYLRNFSLELSKQFFADEFYN